VVHGRFEAEAPNLLWTGDVLHGPHVAGRKTYLFAFIDDHSRLITGFDAQIQENIKQFGADTAFITRFDQGPHSDRRPKEERERKPLTLEDAQALQESCPAIRTVTTWTSWWEKDHAVRTKSGTVTAVDADGKGFALRYAGPSAVRRYRFNEKTVVVFTNLDENNASPERIAAAVAGVYIPALSQ